MSLPVMPSTHTWVQGGPVLEKAGRNTLYASDSEVVWVWDEDTGVQVTDLRDANGNTISTVPIVNGWVTGVGVPVAVVLPSFSVGQTGPHYPGLPVQTIRNAGGALAATDALIATDVNTSGSATDAALKALYAPKTGSTVYETQAHAATTYAPATGSTAYAPLPSSGAAYNLYYRNGSNVAGWTTSQASVARALGWVIVTDPTYGAVGNGVADDTAAIQAAINTLTGNFGGTVYFPPGQYQISSTLTVGVSEVKLVGSGGNGSRISVTADVDALSFTAGVNRCQVRDLWIGSFATRTAGWGIKINGSAGTQSAYLDMSGVTVQNTYGGIYASYLQQSSWDRIRVIHTIASGITDVGISFIGVKSHRITNSWVLAVSGNTGTHGIQLDSECDTCLFSGVEVIGAGGDGFKFLNSLGAPSTGPRLIFMDRVLVETCLGNGWNLTAGRVPKFTNCWASANQMDGFKVDGIDGADFTQCEANQSGFHGFHYASGVGPYSMVNCRSNYNSQATDNTYNGIQIDASVTYVRIEDSRSGNWFYSFANGQKFGLRVEASGTNNLLVADNNFLGNKTNSVSWLSASTNNRIHGNIGYNPVGNTVVAVPGSGVTYSNNQGFDLTIFITGGTVSSVAIGGVATGLTSGAFRLPAGQTMTLTYTVAPTWTFFGD